MKKKQFFAYLILFQAALFTAFAQDPTPGAETPVIQKTKANRLNTYQKVNGIENWNHYYDLSGYKKGTYNLIIKGVDKSGNIYYEGPINILIDPASDIPVVNINNPAPEMRVGGKNLNIVGTCVDDDAVSYVEVKIDDGDYRRAEGKEFWSYYLNTTELIDGRHTISARGVDINGKEGKPVSGVFNLDTANPINAVTSHSNGVLVSGNVTIKGQVTDLNGVAALAMSTDGGREFTPLALSYNKKENSYLFKMAINTVKMKDGPHVYWFKSMDKTGSTGHSAFLFFVDNTNPRITILKPAEGEKVNGRTFVSGKTTDEIGITRFTYQLEKETGEIPLIPGNPYWIKEFDFSSLKGKTADITFRAEDVTGNITISRVKFPLDREADLPVITLVAPENNALVTGDVLLSGFTADDDGVKEISYALDGERPVNREAGDAFSFIIDEVKPGKHKLAVRGTDIYGVAGKETTVEFTRAGANPVIGINTLRMDKEEFPFMPGIEVLRDKNPVLAGQVQIEDKIKNAVYRFREQEFKNLSFKKGQGTSFDFEIMAGKEIQLGINTLDIQVTDIYDRITEFNTFIHVRNYTRINAEPGIYITDARADSKRVRITAADPLTCLFVGDPVRGVEFTPATGVVRISREGNSLKVYPQETGVSEKIRIKVTTIYNEIFESDGMVFITDNTGPELKIAAPVTGQWCRDTLTITGTATDPSGIQSVEYSLDNRATFSGLPFNIDGKMAEFSKEISLAGREDGNVTLFIRAADKSDNISQKAFSLNKDTTPAEITILAPRQDDAGLPGKLLIMGRVGDNGRIREIQFSSDNSEYKKIADTSFFRQEISLSDYPVLPSAFFIKATDYSGNSAVATVALPAASPSSMYVQGGDGDYRTDTSQKETGKPVLVLAGTDSNGEIHYEAGFSRTDVDQPPDFPRNRSTKLLVSGILKLKGTIESSLQAAELYYGEEDISGKIKVTFDKKSGLSVFNLTLDLKKAEDGAKVFWFKCIDTAGGIHYAPFAFRLDNSPPEIRILSPAEGEAVNGAWTIAGAAVDNIAVRSLIWQYGKEKEKEEIPLFPGNPYWSRTLNLEGMTGSAGTINLTATDLAGNVSVLNYKFNVDKNSDLPVAAIVYPANKAQIAGYSVPVLGISHDDDGIDKIIYTIDKNEAKEIKVSDAFNLELTGLATGTHAVVCTPVDINGIRGKSTAVEFTLMGDLPHVQLIRAVRQDWEASWSTGILVPDDSGKALLEGVCTTEAAEGEFSLLEGPGIKLVLKTVKGSAEKSFTIPLPSSLPYGRIDVSVKVKDVYNREQVLKSFFYKTAQDDPAAIIDEEALYFSDSAIKGNKVVLDETKALTGYFNGRKIKAVTLEPASDFLHVSYDSQYIEIKPVKNGISTDTKIKVTAVNGREFYSPVFRFFADHQKPVIRVESPLTGSWIQNQITIAGTASDDLGITQMAYSLDRGVSFRPVEFQESEVGIKFSETVSTGLDDGNISLLIRALDATGNICEENVNIKQDTQQALVSLITPLAEDTVNGKITVVGAAEDAGAIAFVEFSDNGADFRKIGGTGVFYFDLDFSGYETLPEKFIIQVHDKSGNIARFIPPFKVDTVIDKPVATIQVPENGAVLKNDFVISGMVFDDDGVKTIYYQLDDNPPGTLPGSNNFEIPIKLPDITDNDHTVKVWAEDLGGVKGDVVQSTFVISKAEPVSRLITPGIDTTAQGKVTLEGTSADENGIKAVYISFDNANTYNLAKGQETWSYALDTTVLADGTYSLFIKAVDRTDTEGISTTLINIDNTPPEISLDVPADGDIISENILFDGRAFDNIALTELKAIVSPLDEAEAGRIFELPVDGIFSQQERLDNFRPGWYNVRLEAKDKADNTYYISRNVRIQETVSADKVDIIFPAEGSLLNGYFTLSGKVRSGNRIENVVVYLDDKPAEVVPVTDYGFYKLDFGTGSREGEIAVADGQHSLQVEARLEGDVVLKSDKRNITYSRKGGYVTITSMDVGAYITNRPWLRGTAGYYLDRVDKSEGELHKAYLAELRENRIERVEVSMDNGRTFRKAAGTVKWQFRLETQELPDGELQIIVRAVYHNQGAVTKTILMVDDTPPAVKLLTPEEGKRFNEELVILGTAQDDNGVDEVYVNLRRGDKAGYSVPSFIQGMYLDGHLLGAADWEAGLGLTFFDQVVKLQANIGYAPYQREGNIYPERFFGTTVSVKLLANIAEIPFSALFRSHDWDFLSMCIAIGANFTYFSMSPENFTFYNPDIPYVIIGALLSQIEFPKFKLKDWVAFNTYSFYLEGAASFISSDVFPIIEFNLSFGCRLGLL